MKIKLINWSNTNIDMQESTYKLFFFKDKIEFFT